MPRLLIVCEYPTVLGGENSMLATLPAVAAAGFDVAVAAPFSGPLADALRERGIENVPWETRGEDLKRASIAQLRSSFGTVIQHVRPDLLHSNSLSVARIAGSCALEHDVRSIGHLRDIVNLSEQAIADINLNRLLIAVSAATRDYHVLRGLDGAKCVVAHSGVDLNEFRPRGPTGYLHRELNLPGDAQLIAVIGQLGLRKGTDVALAAAKQVATEIPGAHWLIVGERTSAKQESREFEARLRQMASEIPLAGRVHFLGTRNDIPHLLAECKLLVHAALQEPLGRVLLEAAASGLAIVATDVGGTREIFTLAANAVVLVSPNDATSIADATVRLLQNDDERKSIGAAARLRAEEAFDHRAASARLIEIYQRVLN